MGMVNFHDHHTHPTIKMLGLQASQTFPLAAMLLFCCSLRSYAHPFTIPPSRTISRHVSTRLPNPTTSRNHHNMLNINHALQAKHMSKKVGRGACGAVLLDRISTLIQLTIKRNFCAAEALQSFAQGAPGTSPVPWLFASVLGSWMG